MSAKHTATQEAGQAKSNEKWEIDQIDAFNAWSLRQKNIDPFSAMFAWMASARHQAAQAAPAASDITPWEERKHVGGSVRNSAACMFEEINELRAALAARAAPVVPEGWRERLCKMSEASYTYSQYPELAHSIFDSVINALDELEAASPSPPAQEKQ